MFRTNAGLITPYRDQISKIMENDFSSTKKYNLTEELQVALKEFFGQLYLWCVTIIIIVIIAVIIYW